jgi:hypothetical protein
MAQSSLFARVRLIVLLVGTGAIGYAAVTAERRLANHPQTIPAALARLEQAGATFHVVTASTQGDHSQGVYLCARPRQREELHPLPRFAGHAARWEGVVLLT